MSRTRLILLGLLAVVAVGAVVATTSGAEPPAGACTAVTSAPAYCVAGAPLASGATEKFEGTNSGESILKATVSMVKVEIKCATGKSKGTIEGGVGGAVGKSTMTDTFETCKMVKPAACKLSVSAEKEIKTTTLKGELVLNGGRIEDKLEPREGAFAGIEIEGKESSCVIAEVEKPQSFDVTGSQLCEVDSSNTAAETEAATHKIICKYAGSSLKVGGKAEMMSESTVKLVSGKDWSVKET
jgi:hypothetical protein